MVDARKLALGPEELFILSLVDGTLDVDTIAITTGLDGGRTASLLARLVELGVVRIVPAGAGPTRPAPARMTTTPAAAMTQPSPRLPEGATARTQAPAANWQAAATRPPQGLTTKPAPTTVLITQAPSTPQPPLAPAVSSPPPSSGGIDASLSISVELQTRILDLSEKLADLDHFQVLGVPFGAERAAVKRAYFSMIGTFHPDRYFGKQLGGFTKRLERVFQRLTEAHDVLSNPKAREEYEGYLRALGRTRALEELTDQPPPSVEDLEHLLLQAEQAAAKKAAPPQAPSPPPAGPARPAKAPPAMPRAPVARPVVEVADDPVARRAALARKFGKAAPPPPPPRPEPESISDQAARRSAAVKDLHQRYKHRTESIQTNRVERFAKAAEDAIAAGNTVSALNTLRIARTLSGGEIGTVGRIQELEQKLGATVADTYLERARYEESNGHYEQAARSYSNAARSRQDPDVLRSAAECYLKAGVELRLASELARDAVQLAPNRADLRLSLAKIYEAAGMQQSAIRELERALELTPESDRIKQWLKRLKRGGV
ncbi:MAG TPA: DnaJ domain-containing protein [Polyangiaceae bacterium]|nr:DnaJ domain-containing protein [Polyangiaceae bacterium]